MGYTWVVDSIAAPGSITEPYLALVVTSFRYVASRSRRVIHHYPRRLFSPCLNLCRLAADFSSVGMQETKDAGQDGSVLRSRAFLAGGGAEMFGPAPAIFYSTVI